MNEIIKSIDLKPGDEVLSTNHEYGAIDKAWGYVFSNYCMGDYVEFGVSKGDSFINSIKS